MSLPACTVDVVKAHAVTVGTAVMVGDNEGVVTRLAPMGGSIGAVVTTAKGETTTLWSWSQTVKLPGDEVETVDLVESPPRLSLLPPLPLAVEG